MTYVSCCLAGFPCSFEHLGFREKLGYCKPLPSASLFQLKRAFNGSRSADDQTSSQNQNKKKGGGVKFIAPFSDRWRHVMRRRQMSWHSEMPACLMKRDFFWARPGFIWRPGFLVVHFCLAPDERFEIRQMRRIRDLPKQIVDGRSSDCSFCIDLYYKGTLTLILKGEVSVWLTSLSLLARNQLHHCM